MRKEDPLNTKHGALAIAAAVALGTAVLAGCGAPSPPAASRAAVTAGTGAAAPSAAKEITIGLSMYTLAAPYFAAQNNAVKKKAAKKPASKKSAGKKK